MKVILLKDVAKIGRRHEVAEVPDGYALNMLIPKGLAKAGTPENIKKLTSEKQVSDQQQAADDKAFADAVSSLKVSGLSVRLPANEQGHLFAALKAEQVKAAAADAGVMLEISWVTFAEPIKVTGEHNLTLEAGGNKEEVTVTVVAA
ncbi:50S ribosomal protein L9 [Candidatus Kaiserbacteria bacterium]|nr:50S ribosomal protein L9 [Candidatus Kaiserbacteria bacterium]MCB9811794.1 50S ribosomal protein L9 [Candidatus Nomurabacteria bacterium]